VLETRALRKRLGGRWVVDDVTLVVRPGEVVGLLGPNGAGKTVTFSLVAGLLRPQGGCVLLDGVDVTHMPMHLRARRGLAYLPQERSVFHGLTAQDNIASVLEVRGRSRDDAQLEARRLLEEFGLRRVGDVVARRLSGGEQRRLEVVRCLATHPRFVLLDEPFAGLDPLGIAAVRDVLNVLRQRGIGVLLTDHNVAETLAICDRAYVLFAGRVIAEGTADVLRRSDEVRRRFLGPEPMMTTAPPRSAPPGTLSPLAT
jgi:lipopolysaccharide export system ATP-binding protein